MVRLLTIAALVAVAVLFFTRWLPRLLGKGNSGVRRRSSPDSVVCADCGTRYNPAATGWNCPKCGK
jgi:hypothetical protein